MPPSDPRTQEILREIQRHAEEIERLTRELGGPMGATGRFKKNALTQEQLLLLVRAPKKEKRK